MGAPLKPLRVDSALRALSTLRGLRGAPEVPPLCRETQSLGQQILNAPVGINGLIKKRPGGKFCVRVMAGMGIVSVGNEWIGKSSSGKWIKLVKPRLGKVRVGN